jgi:molybdenum-dependent DNA-binding transcriptional regulator ModE
MSQKILLGGVEYDTSKLSPEGQNLLAAFNHVNKQLQEAVNMQALLTRAKNSYISELKSEMVKGKTGLDLSDLFGDD